jgi:hypothetical protein
MAAHVMCQIVPSIIKKVRDCVQLLIIGLAVDRGRKSACLAREVMIGGGLINLMPLLLIQAMLQGT